MALLSEETRIDVHAPEEICLAQSRRPIGASPLSLIDGLTVTSTGEVLSIEARVTVDPEDVSIAAHFPGLPVFPGVFLIELLLQAVSAALPDSSEAALRMNEIRSARFTAPLLSGDTVLLRAEIHRTADCFDTDAVCTRRDGAVAARLKVSFLYDR